MAGGYTQNTQLAHKALDTLIPKWYCMRKTRRRREMRRWSSWQPFDREQLMNVPPSSCVYELGDRTSETYKYGMSATSCRRRLAEQLGATSDFRWRESKSPQKDEANLVRYYEEKHQELPPGNNVRPKIQGGGRAMDGSILLAGGTALAGVVLAGFVVWATREWRSRRRKRPEQEA